MTLADDVDMMLARKGYGSFPQPPTPVRAEYGLPAGTWVNCRGVRHFMAADPTWRPDKHVTNGADSVLMRLMQEPPCTNVPAWRAHRHICDDCGCLLFGIENCPQCEWLSQADERTA